MIKRFASLAALTLVTAGVAAFSVSSTSSTSALCYTTVHPHTMPGVINDPKNGIGVETGEYHVHQNCV